MNRALLSRRSLAALIVLNFAALTVGLAYSGGAARPATGFPTRPVKLIVPFNAGGGTDVYARMFEKAVKDNGLLPQPLVIINRGGAGATEGSRHVKNALPDGYTVLILHDALMTAQAAGVVSYGPEVFEPIAATSEVGMVITVRDDSPYKSLRDLMEAARLKPHTIPFGVNIGAVTHFAGLQLESKSRGSFFRYVPVGGGADRYANLKGGHLAVTGFSIEEFIRFRSDGLRGLAYFGEHRHPAASDVPTAREQGYDLVSGNTFYWWVPKGTPQDRIDVLADMLQRAMQTPYIKQQMAENHFTPIFLRGEPLRKRIEATKQEFGRVTLRKAADLPNMPAIVLGVVGCLAVGVVALSFRDRRRADLTGPAAAEIAPRKHYGLAAACVAMTIAYIAALSLGWVDFRLATIVFVAAVGATLTGWRWRAAPGLLLMAQVLGFGLHYLFTQVFVIDLP